MYDFVIIGGGIIGLSIAKTLIENDKDAVIAIIEKEGEVAMHASGRNSGVLHAGFYYSSNSLKAKFARIGNQEMRQYCKTKALKINECGKVVLAQNEDEVKGLEELKRRGDINRVELHWISVSELNKNYPNLKTTQKALWSPTTSTIDPKEICISLKKDLLEKQVSIFTDTKYLKRISSNSILTNGGEIKYKRLINCAGLYADKIAKDFGLAKNYTIIPFKGIYIEDKKNVSHLQTNAYPVPNLKNPFLGVHFTFAVDGSAKIGPTAIPAFWRENYKGFDNFNLKEMINILYYEAKLFFTNAFGFRSLAYDEIRKYYKPYLLKLTKPLTNDMDLSEYKEWTTPGIRAQLLDINTLELVQDFVVEKDENSIHILNAVSPAFTSAFPFARWVVENYVKKEDFADDRSSM